MLIQFNYISIKKITISMKTIKKIRKLLMKVAVNQPTNRNHSFFG
jgi:hypothetical protein